MVVYNYCSRCGRKIKTDRRDPILSLSLESTRRAICSDCDPRSKWIPVYPKIEGEGKLEDWSYKVIETRIGKGLLLIGPRGKQIYLAPAAPRKELKQALNVLPDKAFPNAFGYSRRTRKEVINHAERVMNIK